VPLALSVRLFGGVGQGRTGATLTLATLLLVGVGGCARPQAPLGGPVPETPLRIIATTPGAMAVSGGFAGPVTLRFERRLSERVTTGSLADAVLVSPQTGELTVRISGETVEVRLEGGFQAGTVYRVTLLPRFRDLYQNVMDEPFEFVFSTGGDIEPNLLAGFVADRLTLRPHPGARVDALPLEGGAVHSAVTGADGVFLLPYLPSGRYEVVAYEDLNRNGTADFLERQDRIQVALNPGDTLLLTELALLAPDTTAARLTAVTLIDSLTVRATFDDPLDPEGTLEGTVARILRPDGNAPEVDALLHLHAWQLLRAAPLAPQADPAAPPPTPSLPTPPAPLPGRELVLQLSRPLLSGVTYQVEVSGLVNLSGVGGGGGTLDLPIP